ncbi:MAG TPA: hypothetical protein PLY70_15680, partial [Saprospiraceae bacterium]|nr:hypothetical protein [Saprospiraceae bacterium]
MFKYLFLFSFSFALAILMQGQSSNTISNVVISSENHKTGVFVNDKGELQVNVSPADMQKFKAVGFVSYDDFGAKGDGKTDDIDAIAATHAFANQHGLMVKAEDGGTYYISGKQRTAVIQTNTDFGKAAFIIDDTEAQNYTSPVFMVSSALQPFKLKGVSALKRNQHKIDGDFSLP